ncbi:hypothetical protein [Streptomyces caelestis]|uniref:Uncharacterized protein n=1 Tax=Streptomyces caelestis TaxID=36816 RepID=A0A7W9HDT1_9ACTN|nr:hypothetical protein [Streptomyces caelestis]MBB5800151.1 hypothetical protein [Streptomyces caelestis]GGW87019.1 hypothetical protein GCM10010320_80680 [Streptomyces caelestis]
MTAAGDRPQDTTRKAALALPDVSQGRPFTPPEEPSPSGDRASTRHATTRPSSSGAGGHF